MAIKLSVSDNSVTLAAERPVTVQTGTTQLEQLLMGTITKIENANVTELGASALYGCTTLVEAYFPNVTQVGGAAFYGCTALKKVSLPAMRVLFGNAFKRCSALEEFIATEPLDKINGYVFSDCLRLRKLDFYYLPSAGLPVQVASGCSNLEAVIIRNTDFVPNCHDSAFGLPGFAAIEGLYIYVPASMVEAYRSSDAWAGASIRAIEDYPEITGG